jgi:hypothetical protein
MISLALRLAVNGGREQLARLAVTMIGIGLGALLLLLVTVAYPAIRAHEQRDAWLNTGPSSAGTLLWRVRYDGFNGRDITRVDVAALSPDAPRPPGLTRLPGPGEYLASPALRALLDRTPPAQLGDRYPGRLTGTVGDAALHSPDSLMVVVGYAPANLRGQPDVLAIDRFATVPTSVPLTRFGRVVLGVGAAALLLPIVVLVGTATRVAAARREQRLAAMSLVGANGRQLAVIAGVEAALGGLGGVVLGFAGLVVVRPWAARLDLDGSPFFPADLRLTVPGALLVGLGVPVLCVAAGMLALRRVRLSPLGIVRKAPTHRPKWTRLVPLAVALAIFVAVTPSLSTSRRPWAPVGIAVVVAALIIGIVVAGPLLTAVVGRLLVAVSRTAPTLLAGRRLIADPVAGFRTVSGLMLAVFLVTVASEAAASSFDAVAPGPARIPDGAVGLQFLYRGDQPLAPDQADGLAARLRTVPGVRGVLDLRRPGSDLVVVTRCADLRAVSLADCPDPSAIIGLDGRSFGNGELVRVPLATTPVADRLPMLGLLVATDGRRATMETVRTTIEQLANRSAELPWTTDEVKGRSSRQSRQIADLSDTILLVTLLIAGCSLTVSVAGGLVERRRPFALLRLTGMRPGALRRMLLVETAGPLLIVTAASVLLGLAVAAQAIRAAGRPWVPPAADYWWFLGGGLALSITIAVGLAMPLLRGLTSTRLE